MINIDYLGCGYTPLWLRQDNELIFKLHISKNEIVCNADDCTSFFAGMEDDEIVVPIRAGDYRNIEYCCAKTRQISAHVPSLQGTKLTFMMQNIQISAQFKSSLYISSIVEINSCVEIECAPRHVLLHLNFARYRGTVDLTSEWTTEISMGGAKEKFAHLYSYLRDTNHFTGKNGEFVEVGMPTMRMFVFRKGGRDIVITPDNLLDVSKTFSALDGSFVCIRYGEGSNFETMDLYFNPRNLKYGEPDNAH